MATPRTFIVPAFLCITSLVLLPGCGEEEPEPSERVQSGLDEAQEGIDQMGDKSKNLQGEIENRREQLAETRVEIQKASMDQVDAYSTRIESLTERISRLPAENEEQYRARLQELKATADNLKSRIGDSLENNGGEQAWDEIKEALSNLKSNFDEFVSDLDSELQE